MKALLAIGCIAILALGGCSQTPSHQADEPDFFWFGRDTKPKAPYWIQVHAEPKAGQYWETVCVAYGYVTRERWQIVSVHGSTAVVEHQFNTDNLHALVDYVKAFEVNLDVPLGEANVIRAWIGKPGEKPTEIKVMEKPEPVEATKAGYELVAEDFVGLELAGREWSGIVSTVVGEDWTSKYWTADHGWFNRVIKQELDGISIELSAFGDDARPLLDW